MKSLVTGAGGYIGSALAAALAEAGDELVLQYFRSNGSENHNAVELRVDLSEASIEPAQLKGVDVVYHCAGIAHQHANEEDYQQVNYAATIALAHRAQAAGVRYFVFLSSVKAESADTPYGYYKQQTELALKALADTTMSNTTMSNTTMSNTTMAIACVRPALVYAETVPGNLASLVSLVRKGLPVPPEAGGRSLVARADLIDLLVGISREDWHGFECVTATDGEVYSTRRLCLAIRSALGKSEPTILLPMSVWRLACTLADVLRRDKQPLYDKLFSDDVHSGHTARERFCWQPRLQFEDLARRMVETS
jgi:nucleoside-diphosphate-sugar epimerase